jgi:uncharacterized membrane protein
MSVGNTHLKGSKKMKETIAGFFQIAGMALFVYAVFYGLYIMDIEHIAAFSILAGIVFVIGAALE